MENTNGYIKTTIIPIKQTVVFMKNNVVRYLEMQLQLTKIATFTLTNYNFTVVNIRRQRSV